MQPQHRIKQPLLFRLGFEGMSFDLEEVQSEREVPRIRSIVVVRRAKEIRLVELDEERCRGTQLFTRQIRFDQLALSQNDIGERVAVYADTHSLKRNLSENERIKTHPKKNCF